LIYLTKVPARALYPKTAEVSQLSQGSKPENASSGLDFNASVASVASVADADSEISIRQADFDERAALVEYGAGVPREWAEGFARLDLGNPSVGFNDARWRLLLDDGGRFLDRWANEAAHLGWQTKDVFGIHPLAPSARFDAMGLVPIINGGEVISIAERSATVRSPGGSKLVYMRRPSSGSVCLWELASRK
jgi:hypothetical protein